MNVGAEAEPREARSARPHVTGSGRRHVVASNYLVQRGRR